MANNNPKHVWFFKGVDQFHLDDNLGHSKEFGHQNFKYVPEAELATLRVENERLREAFTKPDPEILARVCYGVNCYPDELSDMLETYWEAMK